MFAEKPVLEGSRVTLRPVGPEHAEGLYELVRDPEVRRLTGSQGEFDFEGARRWCASRAQHADRLDLAIMTGDGYAGEVVLNALDPANLSCNLRIALIGSRVFGRGYGTEAIELVLGHAFGTTPLHRIELEVYAFNDRARHVYKKIGFVEEGVKRDSLLWDGAWHDCVIMAMLRPGWQVRRGGLA
ncbi:GNAT family N-acetyltransferase [Nonomuraea sp. KC401]|uniref:N-acetyltransferase n=1 Tax=Nonomuraea longispora TaxID=1848320 RepID=A0A4R4NDV2_9ACTN|nr:MULTISPECIES: GNAT family protein [Nonomuraea]NBE97837.1 GNAT family N-acetyltransferase [Nonomuraea sp. K271]TDC06524.1 N-acetyltransferase [Nonomuraea longispora]TLF63012.1 GNAT family N-acetyltransferase [Nonomuraea sp. KC401]